MSQFITDDDLRQMLRQEAEHNQRTELYLDDLREVLAAPAGIRVLRHWLDACRVFGFLSAGGERTVKNAALADYGHERLLEITAASPEAFMRILLAGLREAAADESMN